jgi:hypothetical protein
MGASLMLNFLNACCKLEKLKQIWAEERDNQGQLVNQQIVSRFIHSTDGNISGFSSKFVLIVNFKVFTKIPTRKKLHLFQISEN